MNSLSHLTLLIARFATAALLFIHASQKLKSGLPGFSAYLESLGVAAPSLVSWLIVAGEIGIGIALVLGVLTRISSALLIAMFVGFFVKMSVPAGVFSAKNGIEGELDVTYMLLGLVFLGLGAGKYSLDAALSRRGGKLAKVVGRAA